MDTVDPLVDPPVGPADGFSLGMPLGCIETLNPANAPAKAKYWGDSTEPSMLSALLFQPWSESLTGSRWDYCSAEPKRSVLPKPTAKAKYWGDSTEPSMLSALLVGSSLARGSHAREFTR
jgi:hypothetical protein